MNMEGVGDWSLQGSVGDLDLGQEPSFLVGLTWGGGSLATVPGNLEGLELAAGKPARSCVSCQVPEDRCSAPGDGEGPSREGLTRGGVGGPPSEGLTLGVDW